MAKSNEFQHIDMQHNEIQNVKGHQCNTTPQDVEEAQFWYDTVAKVFKYFNGTVAKLFGKEYTFSTGLTDTNDTITVTDYDKLIKNNATGTQSIAIGASSSTAANNSITIGYNSKSLASNSIALGANAMIDAATTNSIQIGRGTNSTANTLAIGFGKDVNNNDLEYTLLDGSTGLIPDARLSSNIARTSAIPTTVAELTDSSNYALKDDVVKVFNPSGTVASASDLPTLSSSVLGNIYRVTTSFNTTSDFVEGSGKPIQVGNDVVVVNTGTDANPTYKFNVWGDFIDISGKQDVIDSSHKLSADLVDDTSTTHKFVSSSEKDTWNGKQDALGYTPCKKMATNNTALTASGGQVTWSVSNTLETADIGVHVYEISTGTDITACVEITVTSSTITIKMNSSDVAADTYRIVAIG